jgi:acetyl esterase/lipase
MSVSNISERSKTTILPIDADERQHEAALRERFASFWSSAAGEPRMVYDTFIAATPLADDVALDAVDVIDDGPVRGWWVRPAQAKSSGQAMLYLHGGGHVQGSAKAYRGFVSQLVSRMQVPALAIDYPLAPEATLPAASKAALAAWQWLRDQGFTRIAIVGDSAGGGLALVTLAELNKLPREILPIAGAVFSPWTDLSFTGASMTAPALQDPLIGHEYLQDCARKYLGSTDSRNPLASPLFGDLSGLPPLLIQVGTDERLLDDSRQYAERAMQAGVSVQLEIWEGMHHVFQLDVAHLESSRSALSRAARFLLSAFNSESTSVVR